jgi:hypothetical protein
MEAVGQYAGNIDFPTATEGPFNGIVWGGPMNVTVEYDPSQVPAEGPYEFETVNGSNGNINIAVGDMTLTAEMDNSQTVGWPVIQFDDGSFAGLSYFYSFTQDGATYQFTVDGLDWEITNTQSNQVVASGTINSTPAG